MEPGLSNTDPNNFTRSQGFECFQRIGQQERQIVEIRGAGSNHQQRDRTAEQALLIWHVLVHRDRHVKARLIRSGQECAIGQAGEPRVPAGLALVTSEVMSESLVYALVQENAHSMAGKQGFSRLFQSLQGLLLADGREPL